MAGYGAAHAVQRAIGADPRPCRDAISSALRVALIRQAVAIVVRTVADLRVAGEGVRILIIAIRLQPSGAVRASPQAVAISVKIDA